MVIQPSDKWTYEKKYFTRTFSDYVSDNFVWNDHSGYFRIRGVLLQDMLIKSLLDVAFWDQLLNKVTVKVSGVGKWHAKGLTWYACRTFFNEPMIKMCLY